jgi:hypothetical protein
MLRRQVAGRKFALDLKQFHPIDRNCERVPIVARDAVRVYRCAPQQRQDHA